MPKSFEYSLLVANLQDKGLLRRTVIRCENCYCCENEEPLQSGLVLEEGSFQEGSEFLGSTQRNADSGGF